MLGRKNENKEQDKEPVKVDEAIVAEEAKAEAPVEVKKKEADPEKNISKEKLALMKDNSNQEHFVVGQEFKIKDMPFKVMEVKGLELVLRRTDIM